MSNEWKIDVDGVTKDFDTDFGFKVKSWPGTGHSPVANRATPYALQDGAFFTGQRMTARTFTLLGTFYGSTTLAAFHTQRQALIKALSSRTTTINNRPATVTITYTGAAVDKEINVVYEGGLELATFETNIENDVPIRLTAYDPSWKATSDTVTALASVGSITANQVAGKVDGVWSILDTGFNGVAYAVAIGENGDLYGGGGFSTAGGGFAYRVAKWNGTAWSDLDDGMNGDVNAIAVAPNGDVYVGGGFQTTYGGATVNHVAKWDGTSWSALGTGVEAGTTVYALAIGVSGEVYAGGTFTTAGGGAASKIAKWDGTSWSALGTGVDATVYSLDVARNGDLYAGGAFLTAGGVAVKRTAKWNGSTWSALGTVDITAVRALATDINGVLYAGTTNSIVYWDGVAWNSIGATDSSVYALAFSSDGSLYAGGTFTTVGGVSANYAAKWDGVVWAGLEIEPNASVLGIKSYNNDVYIVGSFSGALVTSGATTAAYAGTEIAYPVITINRTGGTTVDIKNIVNTLTTATLNIDYDLLDGETLTIDLRPGQRTVTSSFYGLRWNAILDNSDFASWFLQPDNAAGTTDNIITAYVITTGSPTITTNMTYRTAYRSLD